jgi:hypothetical protein
LNGGLGVGWLVVWWFVLDCMRGEEVIDVGEVIDVLRMGYDIFL